MEEKQDGLSKESDHEVSIIDISPFLVKGKHENDNNILQISKAICNSFEKYGVAIIRDPRVTFSKNEEFLTMMEDYFSQSTKIKEKDMRPKLSYQVGVTPSMKETARNHCKRIDNIYNKPNNKAQVLALDPRHKPLTPCPPEADPKWRYFWKLDKKDSDNQTGIGSDDDDDNNDDDDSKSMASKEYVMLNSDNVVPSGFENRWIKTCDNWGFCLLNTAKTITKAIAIGYNLKDENYFIKLMKNAPHLLAPTATDLNKYGKYGTVIAGYHYDLNFITLHGKSRYPGLTIFLKNGEKLNLSITDGCILVQAGKQLEWVTGGKIYAGFHEVCVNDKTVEKIRQVKEMNINDEKNDQIWRISSTMFAILNTDVILQPIKDDDIKNSDHDDKIQFATKNTLKQYPPTKVQDQVIQELKLLGLYEQE